MRSDTIALSIPAEGVVQYDAFISYRRSDGTTVARWLRRQLEDFRLPKPLRELFGRKLRIYLELFLRAGHERLLRTEHQAGASFMSISSDSRYTGRIDSAS